MTEINSLGRILIFIGFLVIIFGLVLTFAGRISWLGKLPGDIYVQKKNFTFYFPLVTSLVASVILSLILYIISKMHR